MDKIEKIANKIRNEGIKTNIHLTISQITDLLYKLNNAVRQQKTGIGINTILISSIILGLHNDLNVILELLDNCDQR